MRPDPEQTTKDTRVASKRPYLVLLVALPVAAVSLVPVTLVSWPIGLLAIATSITWLTLGVVLHRDRPRRLLGTVVLVLGALWPMQFLPLWDVGPSALIGLTGMTAYWVVGAYLAFRFLPDMPPTTAERRFFAVFAVYSVGTTSLAVAVSRPQWMAFDADSWWPGLWPHQMAFDTLVAAWTFGDGIATTIFVVLMGLRLRRMSALDRSDTALLFASFCAIGAYSVLRGFEGNSYYLTDSQLLPTVALGAFTTIMLMRAEWGRIARDREMSAVLQQRLNGTQLSIDEIESTLRLVLRDPAVRLLPVATSDAVEALRIERRYIRSSDGEALAVIEGARYLERHEKALNAVASACALALENAQLRSAVQEGQRAAFAALKQAERAASELRRLERNLHDDLQQRLLALRLRVGIVGKSAEDDIQQSLEALSGDIGAALEAVRGIARGEIPSELRVLGLEGAVAALVLGSGFEVDVAVDDGIPESMSVAAYFIVCEALNNVTKHAEAKSVEISISIEDGMVQVRVVDDGVGLADAPQGFGLAGIRSRVEELGGVFNLARLDIGTEMKAVMPCV